MPLQMEEVNLANKAWHIIKRGESGARGRTGCGASLLYQSFALIVLHSSWENFFVADISVTLERAMDRGTKTQEESEEGTKDGNGGEIQQGSR